MKTLIIGNGQIGKALYKVFSEYHDEVYTRDKEDLPIDDVDVIHICFPYSESFIDDVRAYQEEYDPKHTIIHSTVPVGTSKALEAIHSPVRGIHPKLESGIRTFTKFLGGENASEVADYFRRCDMKVYLFDKAETTELMKIWSTTWYADDIEKTKQIKRECDETGSPFSAWSLWVQTYNDGYDRLGHPEYSRPNLVPIMKRQGGHCTLPNLELLDNWLTKALKKITNK